MSGDVIRRSTEGIDIAAPTPNSAQYTRPIVTGTRARIAR